ncbi:hypothetical protein VKT23_006283 [Stygiomarasmius scandens]|uniref:Uncharacterized protein n=1 Tax=Marasmiellus scandens TaxID=2682957 RepID=A0ABR1JN01_9AGAR
MELQGVKRTTPLLRLLARKKRNFWRKTLHEIQLQDRRREETRYLALYIRLLQLLVVLSVPYILCYSYLVTPTRVIRAVLWFLKALIWHSGIFEGMYAWVLALEYAPGLLSLYASKPPGTQVSLPYPQHAFKSQRAYVRGFFTREQTVTDVRKNTTIGDIKRELFRRRLIPDPDRRDSRRLLSVFYRPYSASPLEDGLTLQNINFVYGSSLEMSCRVLGGSSGVAGSPSTAVAESSRFTKQTGRFRGQNSEPLDWQPKSTPGGIMYRCKICPDSTQWWPSRRLKEHEKSQKHKRRLRALSTPLSNSSSSSPRHHVEIQPFLSDVFREPGQSTSSFPVNEWIQGVSTSGFNPLETPTYFEDGGLPVPEPGFEFEEDRGDENEDGGLLVPEPGLEFEEGEGDENDSGGDDSATETDSLPGSDDEDAEVSDAEDDGSDYDVGNYTEERMPHVSAEPGSDWYPWYSKEEMANPTVRNHLRFYPEDSRARLSEAWQGTKWLKELDAELLTPMVQRRNQSFFTLEPTMLNDGTVCMPFRWYMQDNSLYARTWAMEYDVNEDGWIVVTHSEREVGENQLLLSFPRLVEEASSLGVPNPRQIIAEESEPGNSVPWQRSNPELGNRWRARAEGKRVVAFPLWLYCDDTSGNLSKKWNKHNSFLFTAEGLPRKYVHRETNIHFVCTSNSAPPLEMLDGIVDQLDKAQDEGVWAWDCKLKEMVLVIPSVLGLLGDNPMQSELACHIGFRGKFFCRVCKVSGNVEGEDGEENADNQSEISMQTNVSKNKEKKKKKKPEESGEDMILRIKQFMTISELRTRSDTLTELEAQFQEGSRVGGATAYRTRKTLTGVKDVYQEYFIDKIQALATAKGRSKPQKEADIATLRRSFPQNTKSPVWRIRGLDPHADTPVEILHVILLGFVKYLWRDAVKRTAKDRDILVARLSSLNVDGLRIPPLAGHTLVNYSGSLTGRDFRAIAQTAPFVLDGLVSKEHLEVWNALSMLVTLAWQPEIRNIEDYTADLKAVIDYFLDCTCRLTPRWFNKPKFHVLLHLPEHIKRFGPAMLFATEGFESYNAIIRASSIHSNRHAPSKDIAHRMARSN